MLKRCHSDSSALIRFIHSTSPAPDIMRLSLLVLNVALCMSISARADGLPEPLGSDDFPIQNTEQVKLGQLLFHDKILSGNRNISCGTCHHPRHFGGDGLSLGIGEGGSGVGPDRHPGVGTERIKRRIPRHAPALWNLGANDIKVLFHDGRLSFSDDYDTGFNSPAEERLPTGLSGLLAAQALFPLASRFEMAGDPEENPVARAAFDRIDHVWPIITRRIQAIPEYEALFTRAFEHIEKAGDITIVDIANALAAFQIVEWQSFDSPFDHYLSGDKTAMTARQLKGMDLFYGEAGCSECHSGRHMSDQQFHALKLPVFGPGRTRRHDPMPRDTGRMAESDSLEDSYRFRTPSLRNVAVTAPYGHNGAFNSLEKMIRHHVDPHSSYDTWQPSDATLPDISWLNDIDFILLHDKREIARYKAVSDIAMTALDDVQIGLISAFLHAVTGYSIESTPLGVPSRVPSNIPVDR